MRGSLHQSFGADRDELEEVEALRLDILLLLELQCGDERGLKSKKELGWRDTAPIWSPIKFSRVPDNGREL